jgi:hypothetical protein
MYIYISIYLLIYGSTVLCWILTVFFSFLILHTVGSTPLDGESSRRKADTYKQNNTNTE